MAGNCAGFGYQPNDRAATRCSHEDTRHDVTTRQDPSADSGLCDCRRLLLRRDIHTHAGDSEQELVIGIDRKAVRLESVRRTRWFFVQGSPRCELRIGEPRRISRQCRKTCLRHRCRGQHLLSHRLRPGNRVSERLASSLSRWRPPGLRSFDDRRGRADAPAIL